MHPQTLQILSETAATTAVTALWQSAVIASGIWLSLKLVPRTSASLRFKIWAAAFVVMAALPFQQFLPHTSATVGTAVPTRPLLELDLRWSLAILALWLAASLYRATDLAIHSYRLGKLWKNATPVQTQICTLRSAELCLTDELQRPSVIGFFYPRILVPAWLYDKLTVDELEQIVLHESQHLRRSDDWTNLLQKLALIVFPLNPALLWIERKLCAEREMACDEGVIQITHAPRAYATFLTRLAERSLQHRSEALSLGTWQRRSDLVPRVHSILTRKRVLNPAAASALLAVLVAAIIGGSIELSRCPQLVGFIAAPPPTQTANAIPATAQFQSTDFQTVSLDTSPKQHLNHAKTSPKPRRHAQSALEASIKSAEIQNTDVQLGSEQSWFVLTTWQQSSQNQSNQGQLTAQRLVLRQLPQGSFVTPTFAAVPTRNGWLVIQL